MSKARINLGKQGEDIATTYLQTHGLIILERNYRQKSGEIDIIARDGEWLVFVEVKTRTSLRFGQPYEAVTQRKQSQISLVALDYITRKNCNNTPIRFDVVSIILPVSGTPEITHLPSCFEATF